jgi:hypothetical protein
MPECPWEREQPSHIGSYGRRPRQELLGPSQPAVSLTIVFTVAAQAELGRSARGVRYIRRCQEISCGWLGSSFFIASNCGP